MNLHWHPIPNEGGGVCGEEHGEGAWVDGERSAVAHDSSGDFIVSWAARWGLSIKQAMGALEEAQEQMGAEGGSEAHSAAVKAQRFYRNGAMAVKSYKGARSFAFDCWLLALGWKDI